MAGDAKVRLRRYAPFGASMEAGKVPPGLYVVATPIGNLGDITLRALETLAGVDIIACEDTRVTRKLIGRYGIGTPSIAYHEHNAAEARPKLLSRLADGQSIALVSDAGTPLISDPGFKLVRAAREAGHHVSVLPGASAVLAALAVGGLPTDRFLFEGFLPPKQAARQKRIATIANIPAFAANVPSVSMASAEMLRAAGLDGHVQHAGAIEQVLADTLGNHAPTIDGVLANLPGGIAELAAISHLASPDGAGVPAWDMMGHGAFAPAPEMVFKVEAVMIHQDAVQPA